jgi:hypothetical protein
VLGQPPTATEPWPLRPIKSYQVYVQRLKIDPEQIVGGHGGRIATRADLLAVTGKGGTS